ncbi:acyl-CoA dehydrogenase family protein [Streptomyces sp. NPDC056453]|uniref:acyl-CoA dehydrogenase family protein n=1 Tax=Streptomyces sp. NPDC056453 TaxID=3345822 RepID=UPI003683FF9D
MRRTIYTDEHQAFRETIRAFIAREVVPNYDQWEVAGKVPLSLYRRLGDLGVLGIAVPGQYGGAGVDGLRFSAIIAEESARAGVVLGALRVHADIVLPYLLDLGTEEQLRRWMPGFVSGEMMTAIAMTEPGTGSDLAGIHTTARREDDHYILNGAKTFITGGANAHRVLVVCRTSPPDPDNRRTGLSILAVDTASEGFGVGRKLDKIGLKAQDTAELSFQNVRVPVTDLLGEEGQAFGYLSRHLVQERLSIALGAAGTAAAAVELTVAYVNEREVFGRPLAAFQNTRFVLAECQAETQAALALADRCLEAHESGDLTPADVAAAKLFCTEVLGRVADKCLQLHGGYGYIREYPIARLYADARVCRIYGGSNEVQKTLIGSSLGLKK